MRTWNKWWWWAVAAVLAALCGFAWQWGYAGPILSLALIPLVLVQRYRLSRFGVALAYYLAGSSGIPLASAVFFGPGHADSGGHWLEGAALWVGSSVLLAAGWAYADRPWKAAGVLLFDALVPPLAFFDWMSPLSAAGVLFPDCGLLGVVLMLGLLSLLPVLARNRAYPFLLLLIPLLANGLYFSFPGRHDKVIQGINLHLGPSTHSILTNFQHLQSWVAVADQPKKAKVLLLPETLLTWWPGNAHYIEQHVPEGQTWLVGASIPLKKGLFADGIEAVTSRRSKLIFASVLPVPVSMWRPWHTPTGDSFGRMDYKAFWWQKPVTLPGATLDGKTVWASICYDQLLPFSWMEAALYRPDILLLTNNVWWAKGTGIPRIQKASAWAWSRLTGSREIEAENE
jgi:hypothetical protein